MFLVVVVVVFAEFCEVLVFVDVLDGCCIECVLVGFFEDVLGVGC